MHELFLQAAFTKWDLTEEEFQIILRACNPGTYMEYQKKLVYDSMHIMQSNSLKHVSFCWVRLANVYGVGDHSKKILSNIIDGAYKNKRIVFKNINAFVDFFYIDDAATGILLAMFSDCEGVVNLGSGYGYYLSNIQDFIQSYLQKTTDDTKIKIRTHLDSTFGSVLDISRASVELNYKSSISMEVGLSKCVEFLRHKL